MLKPLGLARDLGAYDPQRVAVVARPGDPPDAAAGDRHLERTGARTIVRTGGLGEASHQLWHAISLAWPAATKPPLLILGNIWPTLRFGILAAGLDKLGVLFYFRYFRGREDGGVAQLVRAAE